MKCEDVALSPVPGMRVAHAHAQACVTLGYTAQEVCCTRTHPTSHLLVACPRCGSHANWNMHCILISHITYHISHITYHISHITYHISHITYHISHITLDTLLPRALATAPKGLVRLWDGGMPWLTAGM